MKRLLVRVCMLFITAALFYNSTHCTYYKHDLQDQNKMASQFSSKLYNLVIELAKLKGTPGTTDKIITQHEQRVESEKAAASIWLRRTMPNPDDLSPSKRVLLNAISIATEIVGADYDPHITQGHTGSSTPIQKSYVKPDQNLDMVTEGMED